MIIRTLIVGAAFALAVIALPARSQEAPRLRAMVTVHGPLVTLGDLVENAGPASGVAVFQAPDPGTTGTVRAERIVTAANGSGLAGVSAGGLHSVTVTRAARAIDADEVTGVIAGRLAAISGAGRIEDMDVTLDGFSEPVAIESTAVAPLAVRDLQHDSRNGRFSAVLGVADSAALSAGIRVTGRAIEIVEVPVLARAVERGEMISPVDITTERLPRNALRAGTLTDPGAVAGMSARRKLAPGSTLTAEMLMEPVLVGRNEMVTIVFQAPGLTLSTRGRALATGARGDVVRVFNIQSSRTVEAEVIGPGVVSVMPRGIPMAALGTTAR